MSRPLYYYIVCVVDRLCCFLGSANSDGWLFDLLVFIWVAVSLLQSHFCSTFASGTEQDQLCSLVVSRLSEPLGLLRMEAGADS